MRGYFYECSPSVACMPEGRIGSDEPEDGEYDLAITSVDRTEDERREAYKVEWREPADKESLTDRIRDFF